MALLFVYLYHNISRRSFTEVQFPFGLLLNMVDKIVDDGHCDGYGQNGEYGKRDGEI